MDCVARSRDCATVSCLCACRSACRLLSSARRRFCSPALRSCSLIPGLAPLPRLAHGDAEGNDARQREDDEDGYRAPDVFLKPLLAPGVFKLVLDASDGGV